MENIEKLSEREVRIRLANSSGEEYKKLLDRLLEIEKAKNKDVVQRDRNIQ